MGGTALLIILQQMKGLLGLKHFTTKTGVVSVVGAIVKFRHEVFVKLQHNVQINTKHCSPEMIRIFDLSFNLLGTVQLEVHAHWCRIPHISPDH